MYYLSSLVSTIVTVQYDCNGAKPPPAIVPLMWGCPSTQRGQRRIFVSSESTILARRFRPGAEATCYASSADLKIDHGEAT